MKKEVRQVSGTAIGITFSMEEKKIYKIKRGSILDLGDMVVENSQVIQGDTDE